MKTIWFVGGGIEAVPGIQRAKKMGLRVIVSDGNKYAPGLSFADDHYVISTYDVEKTTAAAVYHHKHKYKISGVICIAADVPHTVAQVASILNLPHIQTNIADLMIDKLAMKEYFFSKSIPIPWYQFVPSSQILRDIVAQRGYDLVIKPVDSRGARGVLRLSPEIDLDWAFSRSERESPTKRVMVEQFIAGPQISTESLIIENKAYTIGFADRNYELLNRYAPYFIENGGDLPTKLDDTYKNAVSNLIQLVSTALGLSNAIIKGDIVIHQGKPYVIEMATRLSGGYLCTHEIPLNTGIDFVKQAILLALGEKITLSELQPQYNRSVCQRYIFVKPGRITAITGLEEAANLPGIALCEIRAKIGDVIPPVENHLARPGVVIATGTTHKQAQERVAEAIKKININTISD